MYLAEAFNDSDVDIIEIKKVNENQQDNARF